MFEVLFGDMIYQYLLNRSVYLWYLMLWNFDVIGQTVLVNWVLLSGFLCISMFFQFYLLEGWLFFCYVYFVFHIGHGAVAYFDIVFIEQLVKFVDLREEFIKILACLFIQNFLKNLLYVLKTLFKTLLKTLNMFSLDKCLERQDLLDRCICLKIYGG